MKKQVSLLITPETIELLDAIGKQTNRSVRGDVVTYLALEHQKRQVEEEVKKP